MSDRRESVEGVTAKWQEGDFVWTSQRPTRLCKSYGPGPLIGLTHMTLAKTSLIIMGRSNETYGSSLAHRTSKGALRACGPWKICMKSSSWDVVITSILWLLCDQLYKVCTYPLGPNRPAQAMHDNLQAFYRSQITACWQLEHPYDMSCRYHTGQFGCCGLGFTRTFCRAELYLNDLFSNCSCVCKLFFFLVKDFSGTAEPRILKFGSNVGYNLLYCVRENQPPPAYHSLYLSIFLSLQ